MAIRIIFSPIGVTLGSVLNYRKVVTEPILVSGEKQGGSDADSIVTDARR